MKPIIGILLRKENQKLYVKEEIFRAISLSGGLPIGIDINNKELLNLCHGFILPGGDDYTKEELLLVKKLYNQNKKVLGICLGMQTLGVFSGGILIDINNHKNLSTYVHNINIKKDSLLYKILGKEKILVNSRHKSSVINTNLYIGATSPDLVVEEIESKEKNFFMGIQWHPESLISIDENSKKIFDYFINICKE